MVSWSNIFCYLGRFSTVVELFIDFLTSGSSFVKIVGGKFCGVREVFSALFLFVR